MKSCHLVVVIPALNEAATIANVVTRVPRNLPGIDRIEVLVIDDGSSDGTAECAIQAGAFCFRNDRNEGLGAAIKTGLALSLLSGADAIAHIDADGQFAPEDLKYLVEPIVSGRAGFATCTRFAVPELQPQMPWIKLRGNAWVCGIVNSITGHKFTDVSCGFRAYSRETALKLTIWSRFTYTQESFIRLAHLGVPIVEVPLRVRGEREFGESRIARNLWKFGSQIFIIMLRAMRDTQPLTFFGLLAFSLACLGGLQLGVVLCQFLWAGHAAPWDSLLVTGLMFLSLGGVTAVISLLADQLGRVHRTLDESLYYQRLAHFEKNTLPLGQIAGVLGG